MPEETKLVRSREKFNRKVNYDKQVADEYHKDILRSAEEKQYGNVVVDPKPVPQPIQTEQFEEVDVETEEVVSEEQISLGVKYQKVSIFEKLHQKVLRFERQFEHTPFWLNYLTVFTTVSGLFISLAVSGYIIFEFNNFPDFMPLFYNHTKETWDLVDKSIFLVIPIVISIANVFLIRLSFMAYNFDKKFVYITGITQNLVNVLQIIALVQLLSIVSVIKN